MHKVLDGATMKSEMLLHLSVAKRGYVLKVTYRNYFCASAMSCKPILLKKIRKG